MPQFGLARTQPTAVPDTQTDTDIVWYIWHCFGTLYINISGNCPLIVQNNKMA